jgi:PadR family transcriptional regulator PadR
MEPALGNVATQLRRGVLEHCVLAVLATSPEYAFELVRRLSQVDGLVTSEGTIYPLLARLRRDGLVSTSWAPSESGPPRKYYDLTDSGRRALAAFAAEWTTFTGGVDDLLRQAGVDRGRGVRGGRRDR